MKAVATSTEGIFSDACAQGLECDSALHVCFSQTLEYCRVPLVAKGEENNSLAPLSLEDPVLDAAPSQEFTFNAHYCHSPALPLL